MNYQGLREVARGTVQKCKELLFRFWTAAVVLAGFGWAFYDKPEALTWWKRTVNKIVEATCDKIPYPWGDRIEATLGNFGIWVQITLAVVALRVLVWGTMKLWRLSRA